VGPRAGVWTFGRREEFVASTEIRTPDCSDGSLVAVVAAVVMVVISKCATYYVHLHTYIHIYKYTFTDPTST
jgi:hypothetical protein